MALELMYITNSSKIALIAEKHGVDRVFVDLEVLGKEERQKNMDCVKSHHTVTDVKHIAEVLNSSKLMVRINPWNEDSEKEIESVIAAGADILMLPMWKNSLQVDAFLKTVNKRVSTTLLLETKESVECLDEVLENPLLDEIHIGLNDLHLSYGLDFMFELLANGTVENICRKIAAKNKKYGFGGIARVGEGTLPAESIIKEHYRLGSTRAILSRSFCNCDKITDLDEIEKIFCDNMKNLREFEESISAVTESEYEQNRRFVVEKVNIIAEIMREAKLNEQC